MGYTSTDREAGIATITLDRAERRNAFNGKVKAEIASRLRSLNEDDEVRVVVFQTAGEKIFTAGGDLKEDLDRENHSLRRVAQDWQELYDGMKRLGKPLITKVDGDTYAGGVDLLLYSDFVVSAAEVTFQLPEVEFELLDWQNVSMLPHVAGPKKALEFAMLGTPFSAEEAEGAGIITRVVPKAELDAEVRSMATTLTERDPEILKLIKESVYLSQEMSPTAARSQLLSKSLEHDRDRPEGHALGRKHRLE